MKLISWNVNGLRACLTHGFADSFAALNADIFSVQETKMQPGQADFAPEGYTEYTYSAEKKGYSGTACWCRTQPLAVTTGIGIKRRNAHQAVYTLFRAQEAISIMAVNLDSSTFYTGLITRLIVEHFQRKTVLLRKAGKHTQQHAGPILRFGAAGTCMQCQDSIIGIIFTAEQHT
mgnify:CR=1 FL=1